MVPWVLVRVTLVVGLWEVQGSMVTGDGTLDGLWFLGYL